METEDEQMQDVLSRSERLERLPFTKKLGKLLGTSGVGWALDAMDVGLISFVVAALAEQWGLTDAERSWIISVGFIGMAIGATFGGLLADKIGRRSVFALTLLIYGLATGASALVGSVAVLLIFRFIVGLGLGAELPVASTLMSEFAPKNIRGRVIVWLEAFWALGWIAAALIGYFVVAGSDDGWRWGLLIGAVPALYALIIRLHTPESVRFLETQGKYDEAEGIVQDFEESAGPDYAYAGPTVQSAEDAERLAVPQPDKSETIWSRTMRKRTAALWTIWFAINFSYYGAFTWIPSLLTAQGFSLIKSFEFTLIITLAQLPGYFVAAYLIERIGRRSTLAIFLAGSALAAVLYGQAAADWQIIGAGMMLSFFNLGAWGALYAIGPELYPTTVRGTGTGAAAGFGRIASIITPLLVPVFLSLGGNVLVFTIFSIAFAIAAGAAFFLPEQRGKAIL
ncbi:MFS transporter [Flaviflexus salsibiostraticola]|uniref:MFS transporter n=1 Tax=Flaviflexus salsibiostraticola TaxID=1282737 RepID=A0A3S8ZAH9_9ACTO|nr:MFS transporter [Flaviflexus salsibiostraticola]AZN30471.1 MFS transporter [Flaviflexus salsibiostraticola]